MKFFAYLQECTPEIEIDCIVGVTVIKKDGTEIKGVFDRRVPVSSTLDFEGDLSRNIPNGRTPSLWKFPSIRHDGGESFMVAVTLENDSLRNEIYRAPAHLKMAIFPVSSVEPVRPGGVMTIFKTANGTYRMQGAFDRSHIYHSPTEALNRWPFPADLRFRLKVRLANPQFGWLHGRIGQPTATIDVTNKGQEIEVEGSPISVPVLDAWTRWSDLPSSLKSYYSPHKPGGDFCKGWVDDKWEDICVNVGGNSSSNSETMKIFLECVFLMLKKKYH